MSAISIHSTPRFGSATPGKERQSNSAGGSIRLTRRGRLVFFGVPFVLLAVLGLVLIGFLTAPLNAGVATTAGTGAIEVTVQAGESIWSIAAQAGLDRDVRDVVSEIVQLNDFSSSVLSPGQHIFVPGK